MSPGIKMTRRPAFLALLCGALVSLTALDAQAQEQQDRQVRRLQLQLQALQQQLRDAQAESSKLEAEKEKLATQLGLRDKQAGAAATAQRQTDQKLRGAEAERSALSTEKAALEARLADEARRGTEAMAVKDNELAQLAQKLRVTEAREADLQARFREQVRFVGECTEKNEKLEALGAELLDRYRNKGIGDVLRQREPVLGLSDVKTFNLVQDYRDRLDAARFTPALPQ